MENTKKYFYFCKIVDSGSISAAAKELGVAQPFLSSYIKDLEEKNGCLLFNRSTKPYQLTGCGQAFYKSAKAILLEEKNLENTLSGIKAHDIFLNIGVGSTRVKSLIGDFIVDFLKKNQNVRINIKEILNSDAYESLQNKTTDVVVHFNSLSDKNIISKPIYKEKIVLIKDKKLNGTDVFSLPRIVLPKGQLVREISDDLCGKGRIVLECNKIDTALYYSTKGIGTTILPSYLIKDLPNIDCYDIPDDRCDRKIYVSYKKKNDQKDLILNFVNSLMNSFEYDWSVL